MPDFEAMFVCALHDVVCLTAAQAECVTKGRVGEAAFAGPGNFGHFSVTIGVFVCVGIVFVGSCFGKMLLMISC